MLAEKLCQWVLGILVLSGRIMSRVSHQCLRLWTAPLPRCSTPQQEPKVTLPGEPVFAATSVSCFTNRLSLLLFLWVTWNPTTVWECSWGRTDLATEGEHSMARLALPGCCRVSLGGAHFGDSFSCHGVILLWPLGILLSQTDAKSTALKRLTNNCMGLSSLLTPAQISQSEQVWRRPQR